MKIEGNFLAVKEVEGKGGRNGPVITYRAAYIPKNDPDNFPAVINVEYSVYRELRELSAGEAVQFKVMEVPPYNDKFVVGVQTLATA